MEFIDLQKQYQVMKQEIDQSILTVLGASNYILGESVMQLEDELAEYVGVKHCITCGNGSDALFMLLMAEGIGEGDAVFLPNFAFFDGAEAVGLSGATPIFVDVDENTFNIDPSKLEAAAKGVISECKLNPAAVIPANLFGLPACYPEISNIAHNCGFIIIENAAQSFGGSITKRKSGSFGKAGTTSFFPSEPLSCYGDGGAIFTDDDTLAETIYSLREHGSKGSKYNHIRIGMDSKLDTLQAAVLLVKLTAFKNYELERRSELADLYTQKLSGIVKTPVVPEGYFSSWARYTIRFENEDLRDHIKAELEERGIPTRIYYEKPLNRQEVYRGKLQFEKFFEISEKLCAQALSLPLYPYLSNEEVNFICESIIDSVESFHIKSKRGN
jgi:dTDP-4-amino-4,6-dideoxygalactose transaminase